MSITVSSIYRYPIKGLSAEALDQVNLSVGQCIPHDRRFAIAHATTQIDPEHPEWLPKTRFFMLARDEKLAQLRTRFDEHSGIVHIEQSGRSILSARITDSQGHASLQAFFSEFLMDYPGGPPHLVEAPGHTFSDARQKPNSTTYKYVSLVNLASVRDLERVAGIAIDPDRFRANVYFEGAPAWSEQEWIGMELGLGKARLRIVSLTARCPATAVNPTTAERDLDIPRILREEFGHSHMGVYAEVIEGGMVKTDDFLLPLREDEQSIIHSPDHHLAKTPGSRP